MQIDYKIEISRKQLQSDLIEKFIIANPRIEPNKDKVIQLTEDHFQPFVGKRESL